MLGNILPPYHSLQELNLDWILTKVKDMLRFLPDDGSVGQILRRTAHGAEWSNEQGGGAVNSVNGQTGDVVLTAADVGALADTTPIPDSTSDLINDSGFVDAAGAAAAAPVQSVNGQTGAVSLTIPTDTADLTNTAGFVDAAGAAAAAPVQSVNGQTGAVVIPSSSPTEYTDSETTSLSTAISKTYTVSGNGYIIATASIYTDSTSDTGNTYCIIYKNGNVMFGQAISIDTARAYVQGAGGSIAFTVSNGDTVELYCRSTKSGSKTIRRTVLAFGCTLS